MAAELLSDLSRATDSNSSPLSGALWYFYATGTLSPQSVYTTAALDVAHANPVVADSGGRFPPIYFDSTLQYRGILKDADGTTLPNGDIDPINAGIMGQLAAPSGSSLVGFLQAGSGAVTRTLRDKAREFVSVLDFGAVGDGTTDDTEAAQLAIGTGKNVLFPEGYTFAVSGLTGFANNRRYYGGGCLKKYGSVQEAICLLPDGSDGVWFDGLEFDGSKSLFAYGLPAPAILGYLTQSLRVTNCYFHDVIDAGIKLLDGAELYAAGNRFIDVMENGIEIHHYDRDTRTNTAYTGTRPTIQGNHTIIGNLFRGITRLESGGTLVDACAVALLSDEPGGGTGRRHYNVRIIGNHIEDCLRGIVHETNEAGLEMIGLLIEGNTFHGGVAGGTAEGIYCKNAILINAAHNVIVRGNYIRNPGNHELTDPASITTSGITVTASDGVTTSQDIDIIDNQIIDDSGGSERTEYGVYVAHGDNVRISGNRTSGMRTAPIGMAATYATNISLTDNPGGATSDSWVGPVVSYGPFTATDLAASANTDLLVDGVTGMDDLRIASPGRIVGMIARLSEAPASGSIVLKAYASTVEQPEVEIANSVFGGGSRAYVAVASNATDQMAAGADISVKAVTSTLSPATTVDLRVWVLVDHGAKQ